MKPYWDLIAGVFQHQGQPLRPGPQDLVFMRQAVEDYAARSANGPLQVLMMGVTPEIAGMEWPPETRLLAVERSQAMIDKVWPGDIPERRKVACRDWFNLDIGDHSQDILIGDGFLTAMAYPRQYEELGSFFSRWLKPGGLLVIRIFTRPAESETLAGILQDLREGRFCEFDALKWRLGIALQKDIKEGVPVEGILQAWLDLEKQIPGLARKAGWPQARVDMIHIYAGRPTRYYFPTKGEVEAVFSRFFEIVSVDIPDYQFGSSYPTCVFRLPG